MKSKNWILPIIVIAQFCCTSLWFAGNGVMQDLVLDFGLSSTALGTLTSFVQFGFIIGTLVFAFLAIADRYSPSKVFFFSAILGATFNLGTILPNNGINNLLMFRFLTGFFLAGIYPVGMKIAADYFEKGLGRSLGFLVGALVIGTAFPHLLKGFTQELPWQLVLISTSSMALVGGLIILIFVPNGPYRKQSQSLDLKMISKIFRVPKFRSAAFGYFGHMWELYAFWAFVPFMIRYFLEQHPENQVNSPLMSFLIIGLGGVACVFGGFLSERFGHKRVAFIALLLSCICCLLSPIVLGINSIGILLGFLVFWGLVVIADSPLFSTMVADSALAEAKGTALTIVNCIGFSISILSIQLLNLLSKLIEPSFIFLFLAIGPILGLLALRRTGLSQI